MEQAQRDELLLKLSDGQDLMHINIAHLNRGIYGDPENNAIGLIERQKNDDDKFTNLDTELKGIVDEVKANTKCRKKITKVGKIGLKSLGVGTLAGGTTITVFFEKIKVFISTLFQ